MHEFMIILKYAQLLLITRNIWCVITNRKFKYLFALYNSKKLHTEEIIIHNFLFSFQVVELANTLG